MLTSGNRFFTSRLAVIEVKRIQDNESRLIEQIRLGNNVDPHQTQDNMVSDPGLHYLSLILQF